MAGVISGQYRTPVAAQTATSGTPLEVLVDSAGRLVVVTTGGGGGGTSSAFGSAWPTDGTAAGFFDGTNMQGGRVYNADTSGLASEWVQGSILRASAAVGGSVETGTTTHPFVIGVYSIAVGVTAAKGVSATTVTTDHQALDTYTWGGIWIGATGAAVPASAGLAGFRDDAAFTRAARVYDTDSGAGTEYTLGVNLRLSASGASIEAQGQKAMAASIPVVIASDQSAVPISSTQLPSSLGIKTAAGSVSVALASDGTLPLPTGASTAANQATIATNTGNIPAKGTNTMANSSPVTFATDDNAVKALTPQGAVDTLAEVSTSTTGTFGSLAATHGVIIQAHPTNTINVRISGAGNAASSTRGIVLAPGKAVFLPVTNASVITYACESAVTSKLEVLAV